VLPGVKQGVKGKGRARHWSPRAWRRKVGAFVVVGDPLLAQATAGVLLEATSMLVGICLCVCICKKGIYSKLNMKISGETIQKE
jgi:hypothetical protein